MQKEIDHVNALYNRDLNRLTSIKNNYFFQISKWRVTNYIKNIYRRHINNWFQKNKLNLDKKRANELEKIKQKYDALPPAPLKKALLIGINYKDTEGELRGCVNDVNDLKKMLTSKYDYSPSNVTTVIDSQATRENILKQFTQLLRSGKSGETLFVSFSGHGYYWDDNYNKDEIDGKDELIVTVDNYAIVDDELKNIIDANLKENVTLIALFDNCHSGTILDLPYHYFKEDKEMIHHSLCKDTKGTVICLSGCRDDQVSMDAYLQGNFNGALTFHFVEMLTHNRSLTWKKLVDSLRSNLELKQFNQVPQITCGRKMDLHQLRIQL
jgi:metacaspase-1